MSSGVNSSHTSVFPRIYLIITRRGEVFRFPASLRFLILSVDNHSSYSSETLNSNGLFYDTSRAWTYFVQPPEIIRSSIFFCFKLLLTESSIWQMKVSQTSRHLETINDFIFWPSAQALQHTKTRVFSWPVDLNRKPWLSFLVIDVIPTISYQIGVSSMT